MIITKLKFRKWYFTSDKGFFDDQSLDDCLLDVNFDMTKIPTDFVNNEYHNLIREKTFEFAKNTFSIDSYVDEDLKITEKLEKDGWYKNVGVVNNNSSSTFPLVHILNKKVVFYLFLEKSGYPDKTQLVDFIWDLHNILNIFESSDIEMKFIGIDGTMQSNEGEIPFKLSTEIILNSTGSKKEILFNINYFIAGLDEAVTKSYLDIKTLFENSCKNIPENNVGSSLNFFERTAIATIHLFLVLPTLIIKMKRLTVENATSIERNIQFNKIRNSEQWVRSEFYKVIQDKLEDIAFSPDYNNTLVEPNENILTFEEEIESDEKLYIDFETFSSPFAYFDGAFSYKHYIGQYSIVYVKDGKIENQKHVLFDNGDDYPGFVKTLTDFILKYNEAYIVAYSISFEQNAFKNVEKFAPGNIDIILNKMKWYDQMKIFSGREKSIDMNFLGKKYSIKYLTEWLFQNRKDLLDDWGVKSYNDLSVSNGVQARDHLIYSFLNNGMTCSSEEVIEYCKNDVYTMISLDAFIRENLEEFKNKHGSASDPESD